MCVLYTYFIHLKLVCAWNNSWWTVDWKRNITILCQSERERSMYDDGMSEFIMTAMPEHRMNEREWMKNVLRHFYLWQLYIHVHNWQADVVIFVHIDMCKKGNEIGDRFNDVFISFILYLNVGHMIFFMLFFSWMHMLRHRWRFCWFQL